ncbi:DEAD/DEAH box helicase [Streptococcus ratti]|uniref:Type III restriction enzyme, res subunit n=1 Tax=Streptococcus ratti FA-1 = DSM 20564 TaxID=699248 RepID=A0ABN0GT89_STRRT|nr:DEAD/DEAH box helicase family protein [Streptococcus ratti]EJN93603.1 Type III restriction enzyme, res subunit [Streptococcus ratti FA-1 = DSM 20564]EMP69764.1 Type III restriction enzyme, res subunit [Streptococcus ratti FA-1 = DSM 20564]QEY07472.1 restriction endonuclease subunit R [Streptococcus ratti]VEI59923.1 DNA endonuclease, type III restriction and modification system [Streptococcus mutans]
MEYKESDLVLKVSKNVNPSIWDEGFFQNFFDLLFGQRTYQKEASETALRFLNSGEYKNISALAKENFSNNDVIRTRWSNNFSLMQDDLDLSDKLSATLDLATGTGKSYVIFGLALVMLATKKVNRVLILVPSLTIESELTQKFKDLLANQQLLKTLGEDFIPPQIVNGDSTLVENSIAIENRNAIYKAQSARNSIVDSLKGNGEKTLVLNDEVHHVYYSESNEWKNFIEDERSNNINFKYVIGVTGTAYKGKNKSGNDYFSNVIYRFSLRDAIEQGFVKDIEYISKEDIPNDKIERWQVILNSHDTIAKRLPSELGIKPITIIVTSRQTMADNKARDFKKFLKQQRQLSDEEVDNVVLSVHSGTQAAVDRMKLKKVNQQGNPVEFIFSVSMLTEGWDVKRVFQIVPDEERAFNSKLLIAQVLGRGLRIPDGWQNNWGIPRVTVFNHEKWSANVEALVNEVLEIRKRLTVGINPDSEYHFDLLNVTYSSKEDVKNYPKMGTYQLWEKGVNLPTDDKVGKSTVTLTDIKSQAERNFETSFEHETLTSLQMANILYSRFEDLEDKEYAGEYQKLWPVSRIQEMVEKSLEDSGNKYITKSLKNRFLTSMNVIFRNTAKVVSYDTNPTEYQYISTKQLPRTTTDLSGFHRNKVLFYSSELRDSLSGDNGSLETFKELSDLSKGYKQSPVENRYHFKTPQFGIVTTGNPETEFLKKLVEDKEVNNSIDSFVKSDDMSFYNIDYSWKKGNHQKTGQFNPDWFIKQNNNIIVVEIKDDSQISDPDTENIGKNKAAVKHFDIINHYFKEKGEKVQYKFTFLTPKDFPTFFKSLTSGNIQTFKSHLDIALDDMN